MTKKVTLASALVHAPRVLVLDEPFEAVDPISAATIRRILAGFVESGGTVVLSSHVMDLVERICTHVAVISDGLVLAAGELDDVRGGRSPRGAVRRPRRRVHRGGGAVVVAHLVRLKLTLLRNIFRRSRAQAIGAVVGIVYFAVLVAGLAVILASLRGSLDAARVVIPLAGAAGIVLWTVVPLFSFGSDPTLDPGRFATFAVPHRELAIGLVAAALVGLPAIASMVLSVGVVVAWSHTVASTAVAVVATADRAADGDHDEPMGLGDHDPARSRAVGAVTSSRSSVCSCSSSSVRRSRSWPTSARACATSPTTAAQVVELVAARLGLGRPG